MRDHLVNKIINEENTATIPEEPSFEMPTRGKIDKYQLGRRSMKVEELDEINNAEVEQLKSDASKLRKEEEDEGMRDNVDEL